MITIFDNKDVIYMHGLLSKPTVNDDYVSVLKILWQHILSKHHEMIRKWVFHHNNICTHDATSV